MSTIIAIPNECTQSSLKILLDKIAIVFKWENQRVKDVTFDLSEVEKVDFMVLLLIYKTIEFCVEHKCISGDCRILHNEYVKGKFSEYGFWNLLNNYLENPRNVDYTDLDFLNKGRFFIAPFPLLRQDNYHERMRDSFLPKIESYYQSQSNISSTVFHCFGEILSNFWEHAVSDTKSIMIAAGTKDYVEIACTDTGCGIISTLSPVLNFTLSKEEVLLRALEKGVTSKQATNHMGFGLWIINQIVSKSKGRLTLISEGYQVTNIEGNIKVEKVPYWKGTIIYVFLGFSSLTTVAKVLEKECTTDIKINFQ